jgi:glycosyl transferase family 1
VTGTSPRVVVDARQLAFPLTGMGRYAVELLRRVTADERWEWVLLSPRPVAADLRDTIPKRVRWVEGEGNGGAEWWMQRAAHRELRGRAGSVFLGLANSVPFLIPGGTRRLLLVYDLTYLTVPLLTHPRDLLQGFVVNLPSILMAQRLLPISTFVKRQLHRILPWTRSRTSVLPLAGTNVGPGTPPATFAERQGFLVVGAHRRKGLDVVLDAYATLPAAIRDRHPLTIVGRSIPGAVARRVTQPELRDRVALRRDATDGELIRLYRQSVAHVYISIHEGLGLPVAEALSAGLPSIVAAGTPMAAFVGGGGIVVGEASAAAVAEGMARLATDARQWQLYSAAAAALGESIGWGPVAAAVLEALA